MDFKRHKFLIGWGAALLVLAGVCLYFLFQKRGQFNEAKTKLQTAETQLTRLRANQPFPSSSNVQLLQKNLVQLEAFQRDLLDKLRANQIEPLDVEPATFPLEAAFRRMAAAAQQNGVRVENNSVYGFDEYVGAIPKRDHVERLTIQLQAVERVCKVVFGCGIVELTSVQRDQFEKARAEPVADMGPRSNRRSGRARAGRQEPVRQAEKQPESPESKLYDIETLQLAFAAKRDALWCLLDQLAALDMVTIVTSMQLEGKDAQTLEKDIQPAAAKPKEGEAAGVGGDMKISMQDMKSHAERLVIGDNPVNVILDVSVYRFKEAEGGDTEVAADVRAGGRS